MPLIFILLYGFFLLFIFLYSLVQLNLVLHFLSKKKSVVARSRLQLQLDDKESWPKVTVQLPIFNEYFVVDRLLEAVAALDYPKDKLQIQVLDDSTDETLSVTEKKVKALKAKGIQIELLHRADRKGFKAGALACGLEVAKGDFIAIFDADFIPGKDFLLQTLPHFGDQKIGVVQTRWTHLNENYSWLTRLQAFGLNAHFGVEQLGRNTAGHFINFNGTAGVWRKECIKDAGGWESDTLTEDLDLSYRAQLRGWKFKYLHHVEAPAELPAVMNALKTQQYRWTKGAAECAKKNLPKVILSRKLRLSTKLHALFHLMNSFIFVCVLFTAVFSIPMLWIKTEFQQYAAFFAWGAFFLLSLAILALFYGASVWDQTQNWTVALKKFFVRFPLFLSVSMGLSLHNSMAVLSGYFGKKTPFVRTPKLNIVHKKDNWRGNRYLSGKRNWLTLFEGLLCVYFLIGVVLAFVLNDFGLLPFHLMLTVGFAFVFFHSFQHARSVRNAWVKE